MGLFTPSQTQQMLLDRILRTAEGYASPYVDVAILYSDSCRDLHCNHVRNVMKLIYEAGLTITACCQWALEPLRCFDSAIIEDGKIKPNDRCKDGSHQKMLLHSNQQGASVRSWLASSDITDH